MTRININLRGRAGNQLFIYSLARKIQIEHNECNVIINDTMQKKERKDFKYDLDKFNVSKKIMHVNNKSFPFYANNNFFPIKIMQKIIPNFTFDLLKQFNVNLWVNASYKPIDINFDKDAYIDGFWQSPKYFDDIKDILIKDLTPKNGIPKEDLELYEKILNTESVCVTVRRGDFISSNNINEYYLCDYQYFTKCITEMKRIVPNASWFIFSDDVNWAKNTLKFPGKVYSESGKDNVAVKLALMSSCKHFIISNSSFSWWAQYLSTNPKKIVFGPSRWYVKKWKNDMLMPDWHLIDV